MDVLKRFANYLRPYAIHLVAILLSTALFVVFSSAAYWLSASFLTTLFSGELVVNPDDNSINGLLKRGTAAILVADSTEATLFRAALAIIFSFLLKNIFGYLQLYYVSFVEQRVIKQIRDQLFSHIISLDLGFFQTERRGHVISTVLNDVERLNIALNKSFTKLMRDPINALVLLVLLVAVSWKLTLAAIVIVPTVGWTVQVLAKRIKKHAIVVQELLARLTSHLQETLSGIRIVKAFVNEKFESSRFQSLTSDHFRSVFSQERLRRLVIPLNEFVGVIIISGILYVGGELVLVQNTINSEDFIRFLVLLFALLNPLLSLGNLTANIRLAEASGSRVFRLLDTETNVPLNRSTNSEFSFDKTLSINKLTFKYSDDTPDVLQNVNLSINKAEHIAIVGKSGSGKSTLINLLPRFYDPSAGDIRVDGEDIRTLDIDKLRGLYGMVTQQVILFHASIYDNIAYGLKDVTEEQVVSAAKAAYADDFIGKLPDGYNTIVGEQGALFSGGQRQRISIARALLRDPSIVILDEATSALDPESEDAVSSALRTLTQGRTVITVTHRLATIQDYKKIVVLDQGVVVGQGSHSHLLESCPQYRELALKQKLVGGVA